MNLHHPQRKDTAPVICQPLDLGRPRGRIGEVVCPGHAVTKSLEKTRQTDIAWIATADDDPRIREQHGDVAKLHDVIGQFVDDAIS